MERSSGSTRDEFWRLQEALTELSNTQSQHTERIMRLEKRLEDGPRPKNVWAPASPFPSILGGSHPGKFKFPEPIRRRHIPAERHLSDGAPRCPSTIGRSFESRSLALQSHDRHPPPDGQSSLIEVIRVALWTNSPVLFVVISSAECVDFH